jgi:hypothetical protein
MNPRWARLPIEMRVVWLGCVLLMGAAAGARPGGGDDAEFFERRIRPLLVEHCFACHSPEKGKIKGGLRVDGRASLLKGGETGPALVPGDPARSLLLEVVSWSHPDLKMPPKTRLAASQIADLAEWVKRGAPWPDTAAAGPAPAGDPREAFDLERRRAQHWSWRPVADPPSPPVKDAGWARDPLDRFVLAKLEEQGLHPAAPASPRDFIRRLSFDLTGLPPRPERVEGYAADPSEAATARLVDELLASSRFGEAWGRHWLDLVRYAETRGHEFDFTIPQAWAYRDYVIRALNADLPYRRFVQEHLAGDLLPEPRLHPVEGFNESVLGTGWWWLGEWIHSPVDIRLDEAERMSNQIDVFGKAFLGLTVSCARCHDHKFDAISQQDYYALAGFIRSSDYRQVRYETWADERRAAERLEELRKHEETGVVRGLALEARSGFATLASRLADPDPRWTAHLERARRDADDPFHAYALAAAGGDLKALSASWKARRARAERALDGAEIVADYRRPDAAWTQDGHRFRALAPGDVVWSQDPARPLRELMSAGALRVDPWWDRFTLAPGLEKETGKQGGADSGLRVRGPDFAITRPRTHVLVRGAAGSFAVVDSHRLVHGPLHGATVSESKKPGRSWISHDLSAYLVPGKLLHHAHVELVPRDPDSALYLIVQSEMAPADPLDLPNALLERAVEDAPAAALLAGRLQALFLEALETPSASPDHAALAGWALAHPEFGAGATETAARHVRAREACADGLKLVSRTAPALLDGLASDEQLLVRGSPANPREAVARRYLEALGGPPVRERSGSGRLGLAEAVTDPEITPLFPRVLVNRIWHHLFGRGIVPSVDDFGKMGLPPTHPELLDHLSLYLMRRDSLKALIRRIVLSSTYRMSSVPPPGAAEKDPSNLLLHHHAPRRLPAEAVRDAMLAVSGRLDPTLHGPPVPVHLDGFQDGRGRPASGPLDGAGRRSLYLGVRRNFLSTMLLAFDFPQPSGPMGRRSVSNVPAQALILRNHPFVHQQAEVWAKRLEKEGRPLRERIEGMFREAFSRPPDPEETAAAAAYLDGPDGSWSGLAHALFQAKEFIFLR